MKRKEKVCFRKPDPYGLFVAFLLFLLPCKTVHFRLKTHLEKEDFGQKSLRGASLVLSFWRLRHLLEFFASASLQRNLILHTTTLNFDVGNWKKNSIFRYKSVASCFEPCFSLQIYAKPELAHRLQTSKMRRNSTSLNICQHDVNIVTVRVVRRRFTAPLKPQRPCVNHFTPNGHYFAYWSGKRPFSLSVNGA